MKLIHGLNHNLNCTKNGSLEAQGNNTVLFVLQNSGY